MTSKIVAPREPCVACWDGIRKTGNGIMPPVHLEQPMILVCIICGGLGVRYEGDDFAIRMADIARYRFALSPPSSSISDPPPVASMVILRKLESAIHELYAHYDAGDDGVREETALSAFVEIGNLFRQRQAENLAQLREEYRKTSDPVTRECIRARFNAERGRLNKAEEQYLETTRRHPTSAEAMSERGHFSMRFRRDMTMAILALRKSVALEPHMARFRLKLALYLYIVGDIPAATATHIAAQRCPDFASEMSAQFGMQVMDPTMNPLQPPPKKKEVN